ncbi:hypothetical protein ACIGXA_27690 [Streptomyces fildesensis]|uniref:Abortive infection protein-like C-terminal domain-containing protein n=1 Tax=Streptomyces fildesensis TaxID=375757 RepID=A0ABW8CCY1_9ACTN
MNLSPITALSSLPQGLRDDLLSAFNEIVRNYRERRWEPAELNGGKLCEAVYTVIVGYVDGQYADRSSKPRNMVASCQALEQKTGAVRAVRIQIPRMLIALYEIRNNRGVGHAGGDVDPNHMDATAVLYMGKWLVAELVRVLHGITTEQATDLVDALIEREIPLIWTDGERKRVLKKGLTWKQKMLLMMLSERGQVGENDLFKWLEHSNAPRFRRDVLRPAHKENLIDFEEVSATIQLLPPGIAEAESIVHSL